MARDAGESANMAENLQENLRISIVIPNFNGAAFIDETLKSVVDQNYPDLELIVVDGASTDGSLAVIDKYRAHMAKLIVEPDRGHADALNKGFAFATGDILGWINSDDILLPHCLAFVDKLFRRRADVDWATGRPASMNEEGVINWVGPLRPWSRLRFLSGDNKWIQQESTFWRRTLWEKAGARLDLRYNVANDFDLWRRFFRHADLFTVDRYLGCFRVREGQRSIKFKSLYEKEMRDILDEELRSLDPDYRSAFELLLPDSAARLKEAAQIARDPRYAICDPPIIRAGEALGWSTVRPMTSAAALGRAMAPSNLARFRNAHKGERCFIMGNGPSLNKMDLSLLAGETVFACNAVFLLFDRISWRPKYYACVDSRVLPDRAAEIDAMLASNPQMHGFFPAVLQEHVGEKKRRATRMVLQPAHNRWYFNERANSEENLPHSMFSYDINDYVVQPFTVAITMLQIAAYMGFSEIILIGCDTDYAVGDSVKRDETGVALTSTADDDRNHFDAAYFGDGRKWHDPQPDKMIMHYAHAREALEAIGVTVVNATAGGKLEVFPRRRFEELFDRSSALTPAKSSAKPASTAPARRRAPDARIAAAVDFAKRSRRALIALFGVMIAAVAAAAALGGTWAPPFILFAAAMLILGGALAAVALRLRGFIVELTRQMTDLSSGARAAPPGAVLAQIEQEEELARLRGEVEMLKTKVCALEGRETAARRIG